MKFISKLRALKPAGRRVLLRVTFALPLTTLALHLLDFQRVYSTLERSIQRTKPSSEDEARQVGRTRRMIRYARLHGPYRGNCLSRSLVL